jgi:hypothetical protein
MRFGDALLRSWGWRAGVGVLSCVVTVIAALFTVAYQNAVRAAYSYHDLFQVWLRWHGRLAVAVWVSWAAFTLAVTIVTWSCVMGLRERPRLAAVRLAAGSWALLVLALLVQIVLAWQSGFGRARPGGTMSVVSGAAQASARTRDATLAKAPLFPAFGWLGLLLMALATVAAAWVLMVEKPAADRSHA